MLKKSFHKFLQRIHGLNQNSSFTDLSGKYSKTVPEIVKTCGDFSQNEVPKQSQVVICGGGLTGCSVAYHLTKDHGWTDVVILEQGRLGGGTTWHGAGLMGTIKATPTETEICQSSLKLYQDLASEGHDIGWKECGSLSLARTKDRMISFRRRAAHAQSRNIECQLLGPEEVRNYCPMLNLENLEGGLWVQGDAVGDELATCLTLASEAIKRGITVVEDCAIQRVVTNEDGAVSQVFTNKGAIACEYFVNCGGYWSRRIGELSQPQVKVPIYPCEHQYLHTLPGDSMDPNMPVIYDYDGHFYIREKQGRYLAGGFEPVSKPIELDEVQDPFKPLPEDWDQFYVLLQEMLFRIPSLENVEVDQLSCFAEGFTPDGKWIVGEAPEIRNYFVASGMKSMGLEAGGGVGKLTADWIVHHDVPHNLDVWELDIRRFLGLHNNPLFLRDRIREIPGFHYNLQYPFSEFVSGRCLRMSPLYPRLYAAGASFGQTMGYERPCYFSGEPSEGTISPRVAVTKTFGKPPWFESVEREYHTCLDTVGLLDYSSYTKVEIWSPSLEVVNFLQFLCSNDVDIPVGHIIHTGMQNQNGGYENDVTLVRLAENRYMMIAPTTQQTRCQVWLRRHLPQESPISFTDVTSMYSTICLMGPNAAPLLSQLTDTDISPEAFPFFTYKELDLCLANGIHALNITHTGELGYSLYIPNEYVLHVYDNLIEHGKKFGIGHVGYYAMRTLRIEKFYAFWGQDLDPTTTPLECGRMFRVKFDKGDFLGREALLKQKEEGPKRVYIQLTLEDHDPDADLWPWGGEPIYLGGRCVGRTTTTGFGYTLGKQVCLGFVHCLDESGKPVPIVNEDDYILKNQFEVDIAGRFFPAKASLHSPTLSPFDQTYGASNA